MFPGYISYVSVSWNPNNPHCGKQAKNKPQQENKPLWQLASKSTCPSLPLRCDQASKKQQAGRSSLQHASTQFLASILFPKIEFCERGTVKIKMQSQSGRDSRFPMGRNIKNPVSPLSSNRQTGRCAEKQNCKSQQGRRQILASKGSCTRQVTRKSTGLRDG